MPKKTKSLLKRPSKSVKVETGGASEKETCNLAKLLCEPELSSLRVILAVDGTGQAAELLDIPAVMKQLGNLTEAVQGGSLAQPEAMLINQAVALQSLFVRLVERGMGQAMMLHFESFLRLALRAQNQCRATLETLATIKNPPNVAFVKQANIAQNQQVNNAPEAPRVQENKIERNELLEAPQNERLDYGEKTTAGGAHPAMATVGKINRATDG